MNTGARRVCRTALGQAVEEPLTVHGGSLAGPALGWHSRTLAQPGLLAPL